MIESNENDEAQNEEDPHESGLENYENLAEAALNEADSLIEA